MSNIQTSRVSWQEAAAQKRAAVNDLIPQEWRIGDVPSAEDQPNITGDYIRQFLTPREVEITETEAEAILAKTTSGEWTAKEVATAFCHRAALGHQLVNCLHEIFFEAAIADAEKLDDYFAKHGKPVGPLHGLPVSLKDQFHVKGVETTMGYVGWIGPGGSSGGEATLWDEGATYVEHEEYQFKNTATAEFNHGIAEIIQALLDAGLRITGMREHQTVSWDAIPGQMEDIGGGEYKLKKEPWRLPLTYTLQAVKE
ncbi:hypothetical protein NLG97_g9244 [Lecanicillium saksenae]|uniref:Uncharacterized protein n=1 Tax=Lecanicillium saksenae TaxID=468837 RepID=A0ACC1QGS6_9HYPO|nr:hypothetical protein NLG97_g9244 [Lecanicillium saksenae]